MTLLRTYT